MRWNGLGTRIVLAVLLLALGFGAYQGGLYLWGFYHYRAATEAVERREFKEAGARLKKCIEVWPNDAPLRLLAARTARRAGDFDEASAQLRAHEKMKGDANANQFEYRLLRLQEGDLRDAAPVFAQCVANPDAADVPLLLEAYIEGSLHALIPALHRGETFGGGTAESEVVRTGEAVELWMRLRPARADQAQGWVWRGHVQAIGNHQAKSLDAMRHALELDPDHFEARLYLAKFLDQYFPAEAAPHLALLLKRYPNNREVQFRSATNFRGLGKFDEACEILDSMLKVDPTNVPLLAERGQIALDLRKPAEAEAWLSRALTEAPHDAKLHLALASCLRMNGKEAEAQQHEDILRQMEGRMRRAQDEKFLANPPVPPR
jgi:tetratricopeptide (TPR) repeat protein